MEILVLVALIVINGLFAMSEIALVTARRARLAKLAEDGDGSAAVAMTLGEDPTRFLSTIQIGITSIGILNGIVGEAALAGPLAEWLQGYGMEQGVSEIGATVLVVVVITYVSIVVGELVPKRMVQRYWSSWSSPTCPSSSGNWFPSGSARSIRKVLPASSPGR